MNYIKGMSMDHHFCAAFNKRKNVSKKFEDIKIYDSLHGNVIRDNAKGVEIHEDGDWDIPNLMDLTDLMIEVVDVVKFIPNLRGVPYE